jgi:hypothetical protein
MGRKERVAADHQSTGLIGEGGRESGLDVGRSSYVEYDQAQAESRNTISA